MTIRVSSIVLAVAALPSAVFVLGIGCVQLLSVDSLHVVASSDGGAVVDQATTDGAAGGGGAQEGSTDACASFPSATTGKSGFEANQCNGYVCNPADNGDVLDGGHCAAGEAGLICVLPVYEAPDAAATPPVDSGSPASSDAGPAESRRYPTPQASPERPIEKPIVETTA